MPAGIGSVFVAERAALIDGVLLPLPAPIGTLVRIPLRPTGTVAAPNPGTQRSLGETDGFGCGSEHFSKVNGSIHR